MLLSMHLEQKNEQIVGAEPMDRKDMAGHILVRPATIRGSRRANSYADVPKNASSPDPQRTVKQTLRRMSVHNSTALDVVAMPL